MTSHHVEKSESGINFLFMGVSSVTGKIAPAKVPSGSPDPLAPSELTNWWTAAFAMPYL